MTVFNNGGTVYNNLAVIYNNNGTVYTNGGTVYNNEGIVYANGGIIYNNAGEVYNNSAEVFSFSEDPVVSSNKIFSYYELKFAGYYEPFILVDGAFTEPGSESMMIGENTVCRISPYPGYVIRSAETVAGDLIWDEGDGSLTLANVDADTTLTLVLQADAPAFSLESGSYVTEQEVSISGPGGCEIYYTLDGSVPDAETGTLYEAAFPVAESCTIKAVAAMDGVETSEVASLMLSFPDVAEVPSSEAPLSAEALIAEDTPNAEETQSAEVSLNSAAPLSFAAPVFADEMEGYFRPYGQAITVTNPGTEDVKIVSVHLEGKDAEAFTLSTGDGKTIPAGGTNNTKWVIRPVKGLAAGSYEATAIFTLSEAESYEVPLSFTVLTN